MKNKTMGYEALLLVQCFIWGVGNPIMKIGLDVITPLFCLSARYIAAFLFFMLIFGRRVLKNVTKKHLMAYLIISIFTAASFITGAFALVYATATNTGFLMATTVLFTPFLSYLILHSKLDKKHMIPIGIVTLGLYLLCSGEGQFSFGLGEGLALICAITGACMLVFSSKYLEDMDPLTTSVMQTGFTGVFCLIFAFLFEDFPDVTNIPLVGWGVILYLAIGCTCIAYVIQNIALRHVPATFVALSFCTEPIFTAIASFFLLREILSWKGLIGAALIMTSIIIASLLPEETDDCEPNQCVPISEE
ncbi:DMT family transporter [Clostridium aminobutyricum]|uniref:DMT family transporter n=1 Tax=Clostridium aminobutyricum TaxID=33953 RepID=A0A939DA09_CLOAM|nr:DMT family transporter [Clostridium aminobutyricum]MBN7773865.1 DMT family transporter [Clostridium aminobutyricum]